MFKLTKLFLIITSIIMFCYFFYTYRKMDMFINDDIYYVNKDMKLGNVYVGNDVKPDEDNKEAMIINTLTIYPTDKLLIGNKINAEKEDKNKLDFHILTKIFNTPFPYIDYENGHPKKLKFNNINDIELNANHLKALKGEKLVPLKNKIYGESNYLLKINSQPQLFENAALKCGFNRDAIQNNHQKLTSIMDNKWKL
jgi:hypothetical protein